MPLSSPIHVPSPRRVKGVLAGFHSLKEPATQTDFASGLTSLIWALGNWAVTGLFEGVCADLDGSSFGELASTLAVSDVLGTAFKATRLEVFFAFEVLLIIGPIKKQVPNLIVQISFDCPAQSNGSNRLH